MINVRKQLETCKQHSPHTFKLKASGTQIADVIAASENFPYDGLVYIDVLVNGDSGTASGVVNGTDIDVTINSETAGYNFITVEVKLFNVETSTFEFRTESPNDIVPFYSVAAAHLAGNPMNIPVGGAAPGEVIRLEIRNSDGDTLAEAVQLTGADSRCNFEISEVIGSLLADFSLPYINPDPSITLNGIEFAFSELPEFDLVITKPIPFGTEVTTLTIAAWPGQLVRELYQSNLNQSYLVNPNFRDFRKASLAPDSKPMYYKVPEYLGFFTGPSIAEDFFELVIRGKAYSGDSPFNSLGVYPPDSDKRYAVQCELLINDDVLQQFSEASFKIESDILNEAGGDAIQESFIGRRRLVKLPQLAHQPFHLVFRNRFGMFENFTFIGNMQEEMIATNEVVNLYVDLDKNVLAHEYKRMRSVTSSRYKVASGQHPPEVIRWLSQELAQCTQAYRLDLNTFQFTKVFILSTEFAAPDTASHTSELVLDFTTDATEGQVKW